MRVIQEIINQINESKKDSFSKQEVIKIVRDLTKEDCMCVKEENISVDLSSYSIEFNGKKLIAPRKVIQVAHYLLSNKTKILSRGKILYDLWGDDVIVGERTVDVHVRKLRMLIGEEYVTTVKGVGYQWKQ